MTNPLVQELNQYVEAARRLRGWQLAYAPEPLAPGPPWSYEARARELAAAASTVLDLGTGGGEVFSRILETLACRAVATEPWYVNAPVAARKLGPKASVVEASSLALPFRDGRFDLVLSRHEEINPEEVARMLSPGGRFLTQQVVPDNWHELRDIFPDMTHFPDHYAAYQAGFRQAGLVI